MVKQSHRTFGLYSQYTRYYGSVYKKNKRIPEYPLINKLAVKHGESE